MHFDVRGPGNKSTRVGTFTKIPQSSVFSASGVSNTIYLSSDPNEICNRITLLLQQKHAGKNSNFINEEIFAIVDKL